MIFSFSFPSKSTSFKIYQETRKKSRAYKCNTTTEARLVASEKKSKDVLIRECASSFPGWNRASAWCEREGAKNVQHYRLWLACSQKRFRRERRVSMGVRKVCDRIYRETEIKRKIEKRDGRVSSLGLSSPRAIYIREFIFRNTFPPWVCGSMWWMEWRLFSWIFNFVIFWKSAQKK